MNSEHFGEHLVSTSVSTSLQEVSTLSTSQVFNPLIIKNRYYHVTTDANVCEHPQSPQSTHQLIQTAHESAHKLLTKPYLSPVSSFILVNRFKKHSVGNRSWLNSHPGSLCLLLCFQQRRHTSIYTEMNPFRHIFNGGPVHGRN